MLLQFAVENYLSFRDRAVLSMLADERVTHEPGHVLQGPGGRQILRAAALYGANGSGKSNLVKALAMVRRIVGQGTRGDERLPIVPFKLDPARRIAPAHFELELIAAGKHCSYGFEATTSQVQAEWLYEIDTSGEERLLFERVAGDEAPRITIGDALSMEPKRRAFLEFVAEGTRRNQLFLAEAGERNVTELGPIREALHDWTIVLPDAPYMPLLDKLEKDDDFRKLMGVVLKDAGTGIDDLRIVKRVLEGLAPQEIELLTSARAMESATVLGDGLNLTVNLDEQGRPVLSDLLGIHRLPDGEQVELSMRAESDGTRRLLNLAPILHLVGAGGADALLVVDELERSLHPLLTRMLLQLFFARAASGAAAQIIFTTHDTNLLDLRILSRDSVWLIEKDAHDRVDEAVAFADASPEPPDEWLFTDIYKEP